MDFTKHLFRASAFGHLMAGQSARLKGPSNEVAKHMLKLKEGGTITEKQQEKVDDFIKKRDTIELSKGAKSYLRKLRKEIKFGRRYELKSKYLTKGIELEEEAITFLSVSHDQVFTNNKDRVYGEFFQGECDVKEGYDTKCSWSLNSLPDTEDDLDALYEYQDRVYMILYGKDWWVTSAILLNMTDWQLKDVLYRESFRWKDNEVPTWRMIELIKLYVYDQYNFERLCELNDCEPTDDKSQEMYGSFIEIPTHERIVEKKVYRDKEIEKLMIEIAKLGRVYLQELEDEANENKK